MVSTINPLPVNNLGVFSKLDNSIIDCRRSLKRFLEYCRGLKAKGKLKLKVGVPSLITVIEFVEILFPMLGLTLMPIRFRA
jgi:hypothetical protein